MPTDTPQHAATIDLLRTSSLAHAISEEIERLILSGSIAPGGRLNEKALAERFGVSRGPVREALQSLAAGGLVTIVPNRGAFVQRLTRHDAVEIYDVRAALFGMACQLLAERIAAVTIGELRALLAQMDVASLKRDIDTYYPLNLRFHALIVEQAGNATLAKTYFGLVSRLHLYRARGLVHGGGFETSNAEHRAIVEALDARDPAAAFATGLAHVARAKQRMTRTAETEASPQEA